MWLRQLSRRNQFSRVSPGVFALLLLQRAGAHEQRSVSLSLIVSGIARRLMEYFDFPLSSDIMIHVSYK